MTFARHGRGQIGPRSPRAPSAPRCARSASSATACCSGASPSSWSSPPLLIYRRPSRPCSARRARPDELLSSLPFPFIVWGADELRRWYCAAAGLQQIPGPDGTFGPEPLPPKIRKNW